ncbi:MAG TPA: beta-ketoacyl-ACP synthase II [Dehalococcoidia bacterium]
MPEFPKVVVTGVGMVTPVGLDAASSWKSLQAGKSGLGRISHFDPEIFEVQIAAEVKDFDPEAYMDRRAARRSGRHTQMAIVAANEAVASSKLGINDSNRDGIGVVLASSGTLFTIGEQDKVIETRGPSRVDPLTVPRVGQYSASARVGRMLEIRGPNSSVNSACASGGDAIGQALNMLRLGYADCMLAGGTEAIITPVAIAALANLGALSKTWNAEPQRGSRPFDAKRSGFVLGEGAAVVILETEEFARARGAPIICELAGAAWSFDATDDTAPDVDGQALAMSRALRNAGMEPDDIDYINAHGTSTELNDKTETAAVKKVFGEQAYGIAMSSTKSMTGHLAAAAGALEASVCVLALRDKIAPPTINQQFADPDCDLDYVPNAARKLAVRAAISNSFGLGGQNSCLAFREYR